MTGDTIVRPVQYIVPVCAAAGAVGGIFGPFGVCSDPFDRRLEDHSESAFSGSFLPDWKAGQEAIVWDMRLPRSLMAGLVGAGLAIVGTALPAVTPDPLADPHLPGISSGGAFGSVLALLHTGMFLGTLTVPMMAFAGTGLTTLFVLGLARLAVAGSASRLVLVDVAVSFVIMSLANVLIFFRRSEGDARGCVLDARRSRLDASDSSCSSAGNLDSPRILFLVEFRQAERRVGG